MELDKKALMALRRLHPGRPLSWTADDYLHEVCAPQQALLAAAGLLFPEFVTVSGSVFLAHALPVADDLEELSRRLQESDSPSDIETSYNRVEIGYAFSDRSLSEEEDGILAEYVRMGWSGKLSAEFPSRTFSVRVLPAVQAIGEVVCVTFSEIRCKQEMRLRESFE